MADKPNRAPQRVPTRTGRQLSSGRSLVGKSVTVGQFLKDTFEWAADEETRAEEERQVEAFQVMSDSAFLQVNLGAVGSTGDTMTKIWMRVGTMIASRGKIFFEREALLQHDIQHMIKKQLFGKQAGVWTKAFCPAGQTAQLFLALENSLIVLLKLQGDSIVVNAGDLLAFESTIFHRVGYTKSISEAFSGGLFSVTLEGYGYVAIMSQGKPLSLAAGPDLPPLLIDPFATIAWSSNLDPEFMANTTLANLLGQGNGHTFQMRFQKSKDGATRGFVVVQPLEVTSRSLTSRIMKPISSIISSSKICCGFPPI